MYLICCNEYMCEWSDFSEDQNEYECCPYCESEDLTIIEEDEYVDDYHEYDPTDEELEEMDLEEEED